MGGAVQNEISRIVQGFFKAPINNDGASELRLK
jgi:hypothetical protein